MPLEVNSPYTGELVCELPCDAPEGIERKLDQARASQRRWSALPLERRVREVSAALDHFRVEAGEVAREITLQMGKPIREARREIETLFERCEHMLAIAPEALAPERLAEHAGVRRRIEHVPLGVVLDIAAWNYPLLIPANVVVPALVAGNAVLLKHSARTPLCGLRFERAFEALGLPGLVANLVVGHAETARLLRERRVDQVCFTGSVRGGGEVCAQAGLGRVGAALELGGADPAYVAEDADLDFAAENIVDGACYNAGQSCCAVERVYVQRELYGPFLERARAVLERYRMGDPLEETTTLGPLASRGAIDLLERQVEDARSRGARLLLGGRRPSPESPFFPPTLLADCPQDAEAMREESFGPLVAVQPVADDGEALARMNYSRYGLTASVWTASRERAERFARELEAGTVYQNRCDYLDPALSWTGVKDSGMGTSLSRFGYLALTRRKSIYLRPQP